MASSDAPLYMLRKHVDTVNHISFIESKLLSCSADGVVILWSVKMRRPTLELVAHGGSAISAHLLDSSSQYFLTSGRDGYIRLWDSESQHSVSQFQSGCLHFCRAKILEHYIDGAGCLATSADIENNMLLWDTRDSKLSGALSVRSVKKADLLNSTSNSSETFGMLTCIEPSSDYCSNHLVFNGFEEGSILVADLRMMRYLTGLQKGSMPILAMGVASKSSELLIGGGDEMIHRFAIESSPVEATEDAEAQTEVSLKDKGSMTLSSPGVSDISYRSDDKVIAIAGWDRTVQLYRRKKMKPLSTLTYHRDGVASVTFNASPMLGGQFASGGKDGNIAIWGLESDSYDTS